MTAGSIQAAILAGGQSRRMGHDKSFLDLNGKPLIQHVIDPLRSLGLDIMLITNTPALYAHLDLPMFTDELPNNGSLGGLYTALVKATAPHVLCVACDMPFLNSALLHWLIALRADYDAVIPVTNATAHNLHAVYARSCLPTILRQIEQHNLRITDFYQSLTVRYVSESELRLYDPDLRSLMNLNTPADVQQAVSGTPE